MEHYVLLPNETILYKCTDCCLKNTTKDKAILILTNLHIIFEIKSKKLFSKELINIEIFSVEDVKIYNDVPQIKQEDSCVEIFFTNEIKCVDLYEKSEVRKFINKSLELLTGKTKAVRISNKVKDAIGIVDDTIGISTVDTIKNVAENGIVGVAFGSLRKNKHALPTDNVSTIANKLNATAGALNSTQGLLGNKIISSKSETEVDSINNQFEALKKLKDLRDSDIITLDEFEAKKKQIMGL